MRLLEIVDKLHRGVIQFLSRVIQLSSLLIRERSQLAHECRNPVYRVARISDRGNEHVNRVLVREISHGVILAGAPDG